MILSHRSFDAKPDVFQVSIDEAGFLVSAEYRANIEEKTKDGVVTGYEADCYYVLRNEPATKKSIVNALLACNDDYTELAQYASEVTRFSDSIITG